MEGYGYEPIFVEGDEPADDAPADGARAGHAVDHIAEIQQRAREQGDDRPVHAGR